MEKRFVAFLALSFAVLLGNIWLTQFLAPDKPVVAKKEKEEDNKIGKGDPRKVQPKKTPSEVKTADPLPKEKPQESGKQPGKPIKADNKIPQQWVTLGSVDPGPANPFRFLVTLTNQGAAIRRLELASERFRDLEDRSGYLGNLAPEETPSGVGCLIGVVGAGTPAANAGLKAGDVLTAIGKDSIRTTDDLLRQMVLTRPGQILDLTVRRGGKVLPVMQATLIRRPLCVMRPESEILLNRKSEIPADFSDPPSLLLTLERIGDQKIEKEAEEIAGIDLREGNWEIVKQTQTVAEFRRVLADSGLEIIKRYSLEKIPAEHLTDADFKAYHLRFDIEIRKTGEGTTEVAYRLDGPTGLPTEGWWYGSKISRSWGGVGVRDMTAWWEGQQPELFGAATIAEGEVAPQKDHSLIYVGVDAKYFSAVLIPQKKQISDIWMAETAPLRIGPEPGPKDNKQLTNVSFRLTSKPQQLEAGGDPLKHSFVLFAGPKKPTLLTAYHQPSDESYNLSELVYYGWPIWAAVAKVMTSVLHVLYGFVGNYGISIILLTVMVRGCMFPLSRKQALNMIKMQELQPEIKKIQEKYKKEMDKRTKAQQDLFRKHNYNPMGGCMVMFLQLPIFIGLYRGLMIDIELRQAPLLGHAIRWCSDLSAPDMLMDWSSFMPDFINQAQGIFGLGPFLNVLPLVTVALFIGQQKMFTPPPTDEQQAMQQKVMKYMMVFIGIMFYKVASGLCLYFIASSIWGIAERKLLPKPAKKTDDAASSEMATGKNSRDRAPAKASSNGNGGQSSRKKKQKKR